jgi:hypothetical protein
MKWGQAHGIDKKMSGMRRPAENERIPVFFLWNEVYQGSRQDGIRQKADKLDRISFDSGRFVCSGLFHLVCIFEGSITKTWNLRFLRRKIFKMQRNRLDSIIKI